MKNRILLLIWFILLALAAIFTGAWVYAVLLLLSALAVVAFLLLGFFCGKKVTMKLKLPKAAEQDGIWKGKLQIVNDSVLPVFLGKGSLHLENHFTGEQMELPFSFSLKGRGKKAIDFQGKSQWCGCIYATLHSWRSYDFFGLAGQKRKAGLSACTVVMPCEQKEDFRFLTKEGFDMESFRYSGARPGDDPGETFDIREYQEGDSIRQIHWKLTGKLDKMMIRQRSFPVDDTVLILAEPYLKEKAPAVAQTLEMEDAVHEDVGDIACVLYMMLSNTNGYFTDIKIKNQHLEQWEMTKEAVMEEALKNTCQMAPPLICTNDENKWGGSFMENGAFCLSKSDKVMGVRLSTNTKEYGAISVFYPGVLQRLAQLMGSDLYILFTSGNESTIYSANESNLEDIKTELNEMVIEYRNAMVFKCRNGMVFEEKLLSEELYYYSRIEDKISVYMEKVKVNFTTVNLKEVH